MGLPMNHDQIPNPTRMGIGHFTTSLIARYRKWQTLRRDIRALSHLSTQTLRDIGLEEYATGDRS